VGKLNQIPWWQWLRPGRWRIAGIYDAADLVPDKLPSNGAALVGTLQRPKWIVFDCPCRRGHRIMLTLDRAHNPHWRITDFKLLSFWPSVDYVTPQQRCHYVMEKGQVVWVPNRIGKR